MKTYAISYHIKFRDIEQVILSIKCIECSYLYVHQKLETKTFMAYPIPYFIVFVITNIYLFYPLLMLVYIFIVLFPKRSLKHNLYTTEHQSSFYTEGLLFLNITIKRPRILLNFFYAVYYITEICKSIMLCCF